MYVYIYVLCFVTGKNAEDLHMILTYGDIQMNFTIYKNNPIAEFFYEKSKADGEFSLPIFKSSIELFFDNSGSFNGNNLNINQFSFEEKTYSAGDLIFSSKYLIFLIYNGKYNAQKVGEVEKS